MNLCLLFISKELLDEYQDRSDITFLKIDVDVCDDTAEEFEITALPSFVVIEKVKNSETNLCHNSILSRFIGKNSPNQVKLEVKNWLKNADEVTQVNKDNIKEDDEKDDEAMSSKTYNENKIMTEESLNCKPKKKKSFTSLIFRDTEFETGDRK